MKFQWTLWMRGFFWDFCALLKHTTCAYSVAASRQKIWLGVVLTAPQVCLHGADLKPTLEWGPLGWTQDTLQWDWQIATVSGTPSAHSPPVPCFKDQLSTSPGLQFGCCSLQQCLEATVYVFWRTCFSSMAKSLLATTIILLWISRRLSNKLVHFRILLAVSVHKIKRLCGQKMKPSTNTYYFHEKSEWTGRPSYTARSQHCGVLHNLLRDSFFLMAHPNGQREGWRLFTGRFWEKKEERCTTVLQAAAAWQNALAENSASSGQKWSTYHNSTDHERCTFSVIAQLCCTKPSSCCRNLDGVFQNMNQGLVLGADLWENTNATEDS